MRFRSLKGWVPSSGESAAKLEAELHRELPAAHQLHGRQAHAVARRFPGNGGPARNQEIKTTRPANMEVVSRNPCDFNFHPVSFNVYTGSRLRVVRLIPRERISSGFTPTWARHSI